MPRRPGRRLPGRWPGSPRGGGATWRIGQSARRHAGHHQRLATGRGRRRRQRQQLIQPPTALGLVAAHPPEMIQAGGQPQPLRRRDSCDQASAARRLSCSASSRSARRGARSPTTPARPPRPAPGTRRGGGRGRPPPRRRLGQPLPRVLPDRLQQAMARLDRPPRRPATSDLSTSCASRSSTCHASMPSPAHDGLGRLQRPAAGEDRQPAQQRPAPARSAARSSSRSSRAASAGAAARSRLPPVSRRKRSSSRAAICSTDSAAHPRRRQLERQRDAVQPRADLGHRRRVAGRSSAKPGCAAGARSTKSCTASEPASAVGGQRRPGRAAASDGTRQAISPAMPQRLAAGRQRPQVGAGAAAARRPARRRHRPGARSCPAPAAGRLSASPAHERPR